MPRRLLLVPVLLGLCATPAQAHNPEVRFIAEHVVPKGLVAGGTTVGGTNQALEGPLLQDGPPATTTKGAVSRVVVQALAWGPDGTLWLVSDDNFNAAQVTQFIALAVR